MAKRRPAVSKFAGEQSQAGVEFVLGGLARDPIISGTGVRDAFGQSEALRGYRCVVVFKRKGEKHGKSGFH